MATLTASWQLPWRWQASGVQRAALKGPPKPAGYEVMNAMGCGGARWGGRLAVTHSLHPQHPNPPAGHPWHDPRACCHQPVATCLLSMAWAGHSGTQQPPATRKLQIKPGEEMTQLSGQTTCSCVRAGCFPPHKDGLSQASQQQSQTAFC